MYEHTSIHLKCRLLRGRRKRQARVCRMRIKDLGLRGFLPCLCMCLTHSERMEMSWTIITNKIRIWEYLSCTVFYQPKHSEQPKELVKKNSSGLSVPSCRFVIATNNSLKSCSMFPYLLRITTILVGQQEQNNKHWSEEELLSVGPHHRLCYPNEPYHHTTGHKGGDTHLRSRGKEFIPGTGCDIKSALAG